jgi:general secretion pathway protein G
MILQQRVSRRTDRPGFTLMEVLVVVAILVVLAGVSSIAVFKYLDKAKSDRARVDVSTITEACKVYKISNGEYPPDLSSLVNGAKPYLENGMEAIMDPWGKQYQYDPSGRNNQGQKPDVYTIDPDGVTIGNWMSTRAGANGVQ